jgi:Nucleotidyltransferase domain
MDLAEQIPPLFLRRSAVSHIELTGSRARGDPTPLSDWDFLVSANPFDALAAQLPAIVAPLHPLASQWDRLSPHKCYMLIVRGPHKIDFLFADVPSRQEPPWEVRAETLGHIDAHFWDWVLWLASKQLRGNKQLVDRELARMVDYLLRPMGVGRPPISIDAAIDEYITLRRIRETELAASVDRALQREVQGGLRRVGLL